MLKVRNNAHTKNAETNACVGYLLRPEIAFNSVYQASPFYAVGGLIGAAKPVRTEHETVIDTDADCIPRIRTVPIL